MNRTLAFAIVSAALLSTPAVAQDLGMSFDQAVYVTCRQAQALPRERRIGFAVALVRRASAHLGVSYAEGSPIDDEIGTMLRAGCTVYPDAFVHAVSATAVRRAANVAPRSVASEWPIPFATAAYLTCEQYAAMTDAQQDAIEFDLAVHAGRQYGHKFEDTESGRAKLDEGMTPLVHGTCRLAPDFLIYAVVARAVQAAVEAEGQAKRAP